MAEGSAALLTFQAAGLGKTIAMYNLGIAYQRGQGVTANQRKALELWEMVEPFDFNGLGCRAG